MSIATIMMPYTEALKRGLEAQNQPSNNNLTRVPPEQAPVSTPNPPKWETSDYSNMDWGINWDKPSSYTPTNEYVRPWDVEGWGADDVVVTPPRSPGNYVPPSRPGIQEGQRDYVFMPTEKEQWRIGDENKRRQALAVGKDWREARLPRKVEEKAPPVYGDWREAKLPERREVNIQPFPRREKPERTPGYGGRIGAPPGTGFTMDFRDSDRDGIDDRHQPGPGMPNPDRPSRDRKPISGRRGEPYQDDSMWKKYPRRETRRPSLRDTLMRDMERRYR